MHGIGVSCQRPQLSDGNQGHTKSAQRHSWPAGALTHTREKRSPSNLGRASQRGQSGGGAARGRCVGGAAVSSPFVPTLEVYAGLTPGDARQSPVHLLPAVKLQRAVTHVVNGALNHELAASVVACAGRGRATRAWHTPAAVQRVLTLPAGHTATSRGPSQLLGS